MQTQKLLKQKKGTQKKLSKDKLGWQRILKSKFDFTICPTKKQGLFKFLLA